MVDSRSASPVARLHQPTRSQWRTSSLPRPIHRFALDADLTDNHLSAFGLWLGCGAIVTVGSFVLAGAVQGVAMAAAVLAVPAIVARRWAGRRTRRLVTDLPDIVDMIGRSLRSGASLTQALTEAVADGPAIVGDELGVVVDGLARGQSAHHALRAWVVRTPEPEVRIVAASLALASRNEAGTTQALDGVSHSLRDRAALAAEIRSHSAQAAASMQALVLLPLLFLGLDLAGSQQTTRFLTREPAGQVCLAFGFLLDLAGWWWMTSIIRRRSPQ